MNYFFIGDGNSYNKYIIESLSKTFENIKYCPPIEYSLNPILKFFYKLHTTPRINDFIPLPFKKIWSKMFFCKSFKKQLKRIDCSKICFVFYGFGFYYKRIQLFDYLRKKYPGCSIGCVLNDRVCLFFNMFHFDNISLLINTFDFVATYNEIDRIKYGLLQSPPIVCDYSDVTNDVSIPETDVFYIGKAKDRLDIIYHVYDICEAHHLHCEFIINGVDKNHQKKAKGIKYNQQLQYDEMLKHAKRSKCIVNIVQSGVQGLTLRDFEAIGLNKLLLTNSVAVTMSSYYNSNKVIWLSNIEKEINKVSSIECLSEKWNDKICVTHDMWNNWEETVLGRV